MTLAVFISYSLLALVVTAHPIVPGNDPQSNIPSVVVQDTVQAFFRSGSRILHQCLDCEDNQDSPLALVPTKDGDNNLSDPVNVDPIKHVVPVGRDVTSVDEEPETQGDADASGPFDCLDDLDGAISPPEEDASPPEDVIPLLEPPVLLPYKENEDNSTISTLASRPGDAKFIHKPLIVLGISCITAALALVCISMGLYATDSIRKRIFTSDMAWELLPMLEKSKSLGSDTEHDDEDGNLGDGKQLIPLRKLPPAVSMNSNVDPECEVVNIVERANDPEPEIEDTDEIFLDVEPEIPEKSVFMVEGISEPLRDIDIPRIVLGDSGSCPDPDFLPLPCLPCLPTPYSTPPPTPPRSPLRRPLQMREASPLAPVSKPAWSIRAADAPPLGLASCTSSARSSPTTVTRSMPPSRPSSPFLSFHIPGELNPDPPVFDWTTDLPMEVGRRAYRAPVPELDIALAMQLRPGFGSGADSAWLVRFLMAMFGWMSVLIGAGGRSE